MKGLSRKLRKYIVTLSTVMILVLFSAASVFATGTTDGDGTSTASSEEGLVIESKEQAFEVLAGTKLKVAKGQSFYNNGEAITPEVTLLYEAEDGTQFDVTDFFEKTVTYDQNTDAGNAFVSAKITGYYADSTDENGNTEKEIISFSESEIIVLNTSFEIEPVSISEATVTGIYTYTGSQITPNVTVTAMFGSETKTLIKDTDYTVSCDNVNAGTAEVTVTGTGNYTGSLTRSFTIQKAALSTSNAKLVLSKTSYTYNAAAIKPGTTVTFGGTRLAKNTDYTVSYANNKNAGTATVTVTGKGNYSGTLTQKFTINKAKITDATVKLSTTKYAYNTKDRKPGTTVTIKLSSTVILKKDTDYTVSYSSNCKSIGTKTVTIKGKGNYIGSIQKNYSVVPEKGTGLKVNKRTTSSLTVACTKAKVSGSKYQFRLFQYNSKTEKWEVKETKNTSSNSVTFSGLTAGRVYHVYVRIYKKVDSKNYIGSWSNCGKTLTTPAKPVVSNAVRTASKTVKVTWKAVNSATGYEVQYSTKSDFSSAKTIKVKGRTTTSKSISNLSSSKTYYVRVRAYRNYNDNTYRGAWSSKKSTAWTNVYASYTTTYNAGNTNRSTNLRLACQAMNGKILSNGATFSFNAIVGKRTAAKGYKEAIIYEGGQEVGGIGGGICQVATTLFNAALKANFTIVERYQHSLTVHYAPLGYDAAIAWGSKNLRFRNNSGVSVKVSAVASGGTLTVKFLTNTYKKPAKVTTKVTKRNGVYTLKRYVNGKCNYTTTSNYLDN